MQFLTIGGVTPYIGVRSERLKGDLAGSECKMTGNSFSQLHVFRPPAGPPPEICCLVGSTPELTTEQYLGVHQDLHDAPCDYIKLESIVGRVPHLSSVRFLTTDNQSHHALLSPVRGSSIHGDVYPQVSFP